MDQTTFIISSLVSMGTMGAVFGAVIDFVSQKFHVDIDPKIEEITEAVLGANCGACGFPGCQGFAKAVVLGESPANGCTPGGEAVTHAVSAIMGVSAELKDKKVARIKCGGCNSMTKFKFKYDGVMDCRIALQVQGGDKACQHGCMGLGSCVTVCPFDAIYMNEEGLPEVIEERCTACGNCVKVCPKMVIDLIDAEKTIHVLCMNQDKGAAAKKKCQVACIACKICVKKCPEEAINMAGNVALIDYSKCTLCGTCVEKCPKKTIHDFRSSPSEPAETS